MSLTGLWKTKDNLRIADRNSDNSGLVLGKGGKPRLQPMEEWLVQLPGKAKHSSNGIAATPGASRTQARRQCSEFYLLGRKVHAAEQGPPAGVRM